MKLWKDRPSWFKGGIVMCCISIIIFIILLIIDPVGKVACASGASHPCFPYWFLPIGPGIVIIAVILNFLRQLGIDLSLSLGFSLLGSIFSLPVYFGLGALIVIIVNWLRRNRYGLYGGLIVVGVDLILEIIGLGLIPSSLSKILYGGIRSFGEVLLNLIIAFIIGVVIGWIVGKIKN